ncbi:WecB/TagA/CpsF family glycosyltransferase [uncultured Clostridium sp.]|uniref:WecB/TagA/CpsF family glycosyltransferase n=1 Tax=uncultured Clostridium sp. TaxID=59620 RepID=UPI0025D7A5A4|nr:WecB/TagA/CpsF family glycosyltransferase [uncultured Clostridium sp.]MDU4882888.1 WecB/TagA/CpsF family glycosyltransferase [Clostridium celatum]MDU7075750.1 WecB/TagA/CpsF family glycosyltransferase [Clostridium celatum]
MGKKEKFKSINILGYNIFSEDIGKCVKAVFSYDKVHIVSGNPEVLYTGLNNKELFDNFTSRSSLIIPDGVGTQISGKILKTPVQEKIAGIELMKKIIAECEKNGEGIYLLGASEENLKACAANIIRDYPKINIVGYHNGFFDLENPKEILEEIKNKKPLALFVAMGCPRQEKFIVKYMDKLPCKIYMGVGGSFDVIAEKVNRAPRWMINIGMEWAYRVAKEPWRIKRLGSIPKFIWIVAKSRGKK